MKSYSCIYAFACTNNNLIALKLPFACLLRAPAKMFVASVQCPICQHPDDFIFCFCQGCGYNQKILRVATVGQVYVDLDAIDAQVQQLLIMTKPLATQKQKDSLQKELKGVLSTLPGYVTFALSLHVTCVIF